ncbi:hypothetical protein MYCTH_2297251 [Thermothelomyces thermophilus ATCC 42464]|uniref:Aminoglycoside phosphotransferase domain-containing protein n=1 Tax=Thermothelomyces thermophilus (strain ATCC 42464 / BCRC 31852 / DSM 1799) TaxID=573729 RepID=G2Q525_THET4|nr:uncharacterized protein MYCTH_2297251 [Thermothelomyces thermophilus ATCC 42464]AEO54563.1 hypothetical protein MYCTH_2297251 [Thermothelomyces thermophilus ATCC 42464]
MAERGGLEMVLSQLPDISLAEFDFLDSSFFVSQYHGTRSCRKLPSPQEVLDASGKPLGCDGVWHFQEFQEPGLLVKFGHRSRVHLEEALALRVINKILPDGVPAPEVFGWKSTRDPGYESNFIYMSFLPGQTLRDAWETLSQKDKASVSQQLAGIVRSLRSVGQSLAGQFIGSLNRGPVQDLYFSPDQHKGPFTSTRAFHDFVQFVSAPWVPVEDRNPDPYRPMLPDAAPICLTHGDLHPGNILVLKSPDGSQITVSGIVDWGQAGWYPDYWEYCKAMIVVPYNDEWREGGWADIMLQPSERELEALEAFEFYWNSRCP